MQGLRVSIFLDRCSACSTVHGLPACLSHPGPQCPASTTLLLTSVSASPPVMCPGPQSFHPFSVVSPFQILFSLIVMSISVARAMPTFLVPEPIFPSQNPVFSHLYGFCSFCPFSLEVSLCTSSLNILIKSRDSG